MPIETSLDESLDKRTQSTGRFPLPDNNLNTSIVRTHKNSIVKLGSDAKTTGRDMIASTTKNNDNARFLVPLVQQRKSSIAELGTQVPRSSNQFARNGSNLMADSHPVSLKPPKQLLDMTFTEKSSSSASSPSPAGKQ